MALTTCNVDTAIIAALPDEPNDTGTDPLTATELKAKFDEAVTALKAWFNATHIPELDAEHLPYIYGAATTIKETIDGIVLGTISDGSITFAKLATAAIASQAEAEAGTASDKLITPERFAQAFDARKFTYGTYTGDGATTARTISVGFDPLVVIVSPLDYNYYSLGPGTTPYDSRSTIVVTPTMTISDYVPAIVTGGFSVKNNGSNDQVYMGFNVNTKVYHYIAFR